MLSFVLDKKNQYSLSHIKISSLYILAFWQKLYNFGVGYLWTIYYRVPFSSVAGTDTEARVDGFM